MSYPPGISKIKMSIDLKSLMNFLKTKISQKNIIKSEFGINKEIEFFQNKEEGADKPVYDNWGYNIDGVCCCILFSKFISRSQN